MADPILVAAATAHRACHNQEQDLGNGKLAGYCIVCGIPWPCETAKTFMRKLGLVPDVLVKEDGVWLGFKASSGKQALLNLEALADKQSGIVGAAIRDWAVDAAKSGEAKP